MVHSVRPTLVWTPPRVDPGNRCGPSLATYHCGCCIGVDLLVRERGTTAGEDPVHLYEPLHFLRHQGAPVERAALTSLRGQQAGQIRVAADRDDRDAAIGLSRKQTAVEGNGARHVPVVTDRVREPLDQLVGVAVFKGVRIAPGNGAERDVGMSIGGVDGIDRCDRHGVGNIGHDAQEPHLALLLQDVGESDGAGVVPPAREVGVDDHARPAPGLFGRRALSK